MNNHLTCSAINIMDYRNIENIKCVEIVPGPISTLYGTNALMAVINVVTKLQKVSMVSSWQLVAGGWSFATQHYKKVIQG